MQIFDTMSRKYVPLDMDTINKIDQIDIKKAAHSKSGWFKTAQQASKLNNVEMELACANAEVMGEEKAKRLYTNYLQLKKAFPDMVKLQRSQTAYVPGYENDPSKEPETWVDNIKDYWECSMFVPARQYGKWKTKLEGIGFKIDIVHKDGEEITSTGIKQLIH